MTAVRWILRAQGAYDLVTDVWPLAHMLVPAAALPGAWFRSGRRA